MERARYNTELYSLINNPSNFLGSLHLQGDLALHDRGALQLVQCLVVVIGVVDLLRHVAVNPAIERCHHVADDVRSCFHLNRYSFDVCFHYAK